MICRSTQEPPVGNHRPGRLFSISHTMSVSFGSGPDSNPAPRGFDSFHRCFCRRLRAPIRTIDNWIAIALRNLAPGHGPDVCSACPGVRKRAVGQRPGHLIWDEEIGSSSLPSSTRRPRHAQLPAERAPLTCPAPEIRSRSGAGRRRPWLNWREHLFTKQEVAGSSPAGRAVSEAEAGDAPGCGPGESGFEPRRTPQQRPSTALRLWPNW